MPQSLSVCIITYNEEANLGRTLASVAELVKRTAGEIIVVDSGSTDKTVEIAKSFGAKLFIEPWKGYAAQKNSAIDKAMGDWILLLDADEEVSPDLRAATAMVCAVPHERIFQLYVSKDGEVGAKDLPQVLPADAYWVPRANFFLGRFIKFGGFWPDWKVRLFRRGRGRVGDRAVHETIIPTGTTAQLRGCCLLHHAYPTLQSYIGHMNKYSTLGAEMVVSEKPRGFSLWNIVVRPWATFIYNYFFRLGFLDGREGLLLHMYHALYVSWKYAKAWEFSRKKSGQKK